MERMKPVVDVVGQNLRKSMQQSDLLTLEQFNALVKADNLEVFSKEGLDKYRNKLFELGKQGNKSTQDAYIQKAKDEFDSLVLKQVIMKGEDGKELIATVYVRPISSENLLKAEGAPGLGGPRPLSVDEYMSFDGEGKITKGFKDKFESKMKEWGISDISELKEKDDEEQKKFWEEIDASHTSKEEGGKKKGKKMMAKGHNGDEDTELSDEEAECLVFIKDVLDEEGDVEVEELENLVEEEGLADKDTMAIVLKLAKLGLIEADEETSEVTGITEEGMEAIAEYEAEEGMEDGDEDDEDGGGMNNDDEDDEGDEGGMNGGDEDEDGGENDDDGEEKEGVMGDEDDEDDDDEEEEGQDDDGVAAPMDEETAKTHAKSAPTENLEDYVKNKENPEEMIEVAQEELDGRNKMDMDGDENEDGDGDEDEEEEVEVKEKKEFEQWVDSHFDDHDIEDLRKMVKLLIMEAPGEMKVLKEHYREEYPGKNKGNKADKIEDESFNEFLDEYLEHKPFPHLKDYAKKLLNKNPDAFVKMKKKYSDLKDNDMLDS